MKAFNILFTFRESNHIANVYYSEAFNGYTIYFTDVELILDFGGKAFYNNNQGLHFLKAGKDVETLKALLTHKIEQLIPAA